MRRPSSTLELKETCRRMRCNLGKTDMEATYFNRYPCIVIYSALLRLFSIFLHLVVLIISQHHLENNKIKTKHTWSIRRCMISLPLPAGTNFSNTPSKLLATCLNVRSIASSFRWSSTSTSSSIDSAALSRSERRVRSWSRCLVKEVYCSNAFLFTCANFLRPSLVWCSFLTSYWVEVNN